MAVCDTAGRKAAGGGDESAARVDASCEQPVKPGRFLTSHQPGTIREPSGLEMRPENVDESPASGYCGGKGWI